MKTAIYKTKLTGLLIVAFLMMAGYSQSQSNCVPDSLTATNVTEHTVNLSWAGITGPTHVRYFPTGTTDYEVRETHMNHLCLHNLLSNTPYSWELSNFCNGEWTEYAGNGSFTTLADTIPPPTCIPTDLAVTDVTAHEVDLTWDGIQGPTWVRYFPAGDTTEYEYKFTRENEVSIHHLLPATTYSWDLNNFCDGQWTGYTGNGSFTTLADTVPTPTCIPTDLTATDVTAHEVDLTWDGIQGPTWVRYFPAGDTTGYEYKFTHENEVSIHHLLPATTYSWDLNNFCDGQWTGYTGNGSFTTLADTVPPPICIPTDLTATDVTAHEVDLTWDGIQGPTWVRYFPAGDTTGYEYKFTHENEVSIHHLLPSTTYSWELNNFCDGQWTGYTGNGSFTTLADTVPPPTCIPTDLTATNVTAHEVDLTWDGIQGPTWVRYFPAGDTTEYEYKFTHENEVSLHHLLPSTTYSWELNNFCDGQWTGYTGNGNFTTLTDTIPAPTCIPTNLTDTNVTAYSVDLSWEGISGPTHVRYCTADTTIYECRETHMNHITLDSLMPNTQYFWDLSNFCEGEWTPYTGDGTFTTLAGTYITGIIIAEGLSASGLSVYPNPMKEVATVIYSSTDNGSYMFKITDITGRVILSGTKQVSAGTNSFELNLTGNPKGIYFLNLQKGSEFKHVRFIKE